MAVPLAAPPRDRRRLTLLAALRLLAFALLVLALVNPPWRVASRRADRPHLTVLLDVSPSMNLPSGTPGQTRTQQAEAALCLPAVQRQLARFDQTVIRFADGLVADTPSAGGTSLALALRQSTRYRPGPLLVISDGAETAGQARAVAADAGPRGQPVFVAGVGPTLPPPNVGPLVIQAPRVVREKQPVPVQVLLRATGFSGAQPVSLGLGGKDARTLSVSLVAGQAATVRTELPGLTAGFHLLTVRTPPRPGEANAADNARSHIIEARRSETNLVLLAGAPDPDYAALRRLLLRVPKLRLQSLVRLGPGGALYQQGESTSRQAPGLTRLLHDAHVVLLMNVTVNASDAAALAAFVRNGGAVGWLAGPQGGTPGALAAVLPAAPAGPYAAILSPVPPPVAAGELGQELLRAAPAATWQRAPFFEGVMPLGPARAGTDTILRSGGRPLLLTGTSGAGATLMLAGAGTYRWLLSAEANEESRRLHEVFWQGLVGWLSQPREQHRLVVIVDPAVSPEGQPVRLLAAMGGAPAKVTAEITGGGQKVSLPLASTGSEPGRYAASLSALPPGKYSVRFSAGALSETRPLVIEPGGLEVAEPLQRVGALQALAKAGGGAYAPLEQLDRLLAQIPTDAAMRTMTRVARPWRGAMPLCLVALLLCGEWWLRRRWGY